MLKGLIFNVTINKFARTLGAYRIAHVLRQEGWDIEVIDFALLWNLDELKVLTRSRVTKNTKFIGFSHMFNTWNDTLESYTKWLKENYPDITLISGSGVNPKFDAQHIDYYVQGFGENAILELLKWRNSNGKMPAFNLIDGNKKVINANTFYPAFPMKDLMVRYEDRDFIQPHEWLTVEFARGCKFKCDFCNFPVLGVKGDYSRDADNFRLQMMDAYDRFGTTNYLVSDETFNDRTEKISKFADVVETLPFDPWFSGFVRADLMISRPKDKEELLRMNFLGQYYGIESFNYESAKSVGKGMHPDRIKQGLIDIKDYFLNNGTKRYRGTISLIIGLPHETKRSLENTRKWLLKNWQGQNFISFTLEIPTGDNDAQSLISKDYKKYGYKEMTKIDDLKKDNLRWPLSLSKDVFLWKNEHMNIIDASRIYDRWVETRYNPRNNFKLDCWSMSHPDFGDLNNRLNIPDQECHAIWVPNDQQLELVKIYKDKKLSI